MRRDDDETERERAASEERVKRHLDSHGQTPLKHEEVPEPTPVCRSCGAPRKWQLTVNDRRFLKRQGILADDGQASSSDV